MPFCIITVGTIMQAVERAGTKACNKGWEAAMAAIEMATLTKSMGQSDKLHTNRGPGSSLHQIRHDKPKPPDPKREKPCAIESR